jgi:hypothetical protein
MMFIVHTETFESRADSDDGWIAQIEADDPNVEYDSEDTDTLHCTRFACPKCSKKTSWGYDYDVDAKYGSESPFVFECRECDLFFTLCKGCWDEGSDNTKSMLLRLVAHDFDDFEAEQRERILSGQRRTPPHENDDDPFAVEGTYKVFKTDYFDDSRDDEHGVYTECPRVEYSNDGIDPACSIFLKYCDDADVRWFDVKYFGPLCGPDGGFASCWHCDTCQKTWSILDK